MRSRVLAPPPGGRQGRGVARGPRPPRAPRRVPPGMGRRAVSPAARSRTTGSRWTRISRARSARWPGSSRARGTADDPVQARGRRGRSPTAIRCSSGALLHDIGKNGEGGHVPVGARVVASILDRMGVEPPARDLVRFMVAQHLLLPDTATRRDLSDENLVLDVAAAVGFPRAPRRALPARQGRCRGDRPRRMDALATDPDPTSSSRRSQHVLERGEMGTELAERARRPDRPDPRPPRGRAGRRRSSGSSGGCRAPTSCRRPGAGRSALRDDRAARRREGRPGRPLRWDASRHLRGARRRAAIARDSCRGSRGPSPSRACRSSPPRCSRPTTGSRPTSSRWKGSGSPRCPSAAGASSAGCSDARSTARSRSNGRVDEKRRWYPAPRVPTPVTVAVDNDASDFSTVIEVGASGPARPPLRHHQDASPSSARRAPREGRDVRRTGRRLLLRPRRARSQAPTTSTRSRRLCATAWGPDTAPPESRDDPAGSTTGCQADARSGARSSSVSRSRFAIFGPAPSSSCLK